MASSLIRQEDITMTRGVTRNTLTDITNSKTVNVETTSAKGIHINQELCKENSPIITLGKEDSFNIENQRDSNFLECNISSSVQRRETYNVDKRITTLPASSSPVFSDCSHEGTYVVQGECKKYSPDSPDSLEDSVFYDSLEGQLSKESRKELSFEAKLDSITVTENKAFVLHIGKFCSFQSLIAIV